MWFKSEKHEKSFVELKDRARVAGDREYEAALYVLAAIHKDVKEYIAPGEIEFEELIEAAGPWSSGEKALVKLAAHLFNSQAWPVIVQDVFYSLDSDSFQAALVALTIRYA